MVVPQRLSRIRPIQVRSKILSSDTRSSSRSSRVIARNGSGMASRRLLAITVTTVRRLVLARRVRTNTFGSRERVFLIRSDISRTPRSRSLSWSLPVEGSDDMRQLSRFTV